MSFRMRPNPPEGGSGSGAAWFVFGVVVDGDLLQVFFLEYMAAVQAAQVIDPVAPH